MQVYNELLPPTAVTHALHLPFTSRKAQNLIVVKTSLLQIYAIKHPQTAADATTNGVNGHASDTPAIAENDKRPRSKLVLVGEYALSGTVTSIASIKAMNTRSGGHALLIAVKDAKISLVEWDPEIYSVSTISIHYYEGDDLQGAPWAPDLAKCDSYLTVDPSSRCAALKFGQRHLAILPFRQPGDDLVMGEYDPDAVDPSIKVNGETRKETPYASSFVLPLTALDSTLIHPVDLAFLYEYREPTLGVLASPREPALSLIQQRKDLLTYTVFTLDIEQRARTPLLSVSGLPADLFKLLPLPLPVGGTLLVGGNEVVHVDQSGKTTAVAVNDFAKECSSFSMADQSDLGLKLEHCTVEQIDKITGEILFILDSGEFIVLSFKLDGRSVNSLSLRRVPAEQDGTICAGSVSCASNLGEGLLFIGSRDCDALLISCERDNGTQSIKKRSHAEMLGLDEDEEEEDIEDEDDLYGGDAVTTKSAAVTLAGQAAGNMGEIKFQTQDRLVNLSPQGIPTFSPSSIRQKTSENMSPGIDIVLATGSRNAGSLSFITNGMKLNVIKELDIANTTDTWALKMKSESDQPYDNIMITTRTSGEGLGSSAIYSITSEATSKRTGTDFESGSATLNADVLGSGTRLVQITHSEVRCYDTDLGLAQIFPMIDEKTDQELKITASSFCDPYILLIRDDHSSIVLKLDRKGELDEVEGAEAFKSSKWKSACLHSPPGADHPLAYLLNTKGTLNVFQLPDLSKPTYVTDLRNLPSTLTENGVAKRLGADQAALVEILICDIGESGHESTYMIVRAEDDELAIFEPYHYPTTLKAQAFTAELRWRKVSSVQPFSSDESSSVNGADGVDGHAASKPQLLRRLANVGGRSVAVLHQRSLTMIVKESKSVIRSIQLENSEIQTITSINAEMCPNGLLTIMSLGTLHIARLESDIDYGTTGWAVRRVDLKENVEDVCFHADSNSFIVATSSQANFFLPDDDWHPEWSEENIAFRPQIDQGALKLVDAISQTVIQEMIFEPDESILCMKVIDLEISEQTHERKPMIVIGTAKIQGEDYGCGGSIYVFDVIQVVPDPEHPERNKSLKMVAKEDLRGPVTALSEVGDQGLVIAAQGQKIMVRGLKEDNTLLPVAFLDVQTMVTSIKNVKGTGLVLVADAMKGLWLVGFSADPYALRVFGKSRSHMQVLTAEFLPQEKQLFILVTDESSNIHVLEFNPEDPKSLSGQRLLHRSTFHTGHYPTSMLLLPSSSPAHASDPIAGNPAAADDDDDTTTDRLTLTPTSSILLTTASGALALLTPLSEATYRRLGALQAHLSTILDHPCGLNSRAFRAVESEGFGGRGILDGLILRRWRELSSQKKIEACNRIGEEVGVVRGWLREIEGSGLGYL